MSTSEAAVTSYLDQLKETRFRIANEYKKNVGEDVFREIIQTCIIVSGEPRPKQHSILYKVLKNNKLISKTLKPFSFTGFVSYDGSSYVINAKTTMRNIFHFILTEEQIYELIK